MFWLTYICAECDRHECIECQYPDRPAQLKIIEASTRPQRTVNGPRASAEELLGVMQRYSYWSSDDLLHLIQQHRESGQSE
jgi:hypothetical protein